jgi:uncharacterized BrkB/YihY/UPF0761 family membrane protein
MLRCYKFDIMDLARPKAVMARLGLLDTAAAEVAFFLALSLVPFVGIVIALVRLFPAGLSVSIGKVLHDVLPAESPVAGEVLRWAGCSGARFALCRYVFTRSAR